MQTNPTIQNSGRLAWSGTTARVIDIRRHVNFGFSFEVIAALAADTVFNVLAHDVNPADNCLPAAGATIPAVAICSQPAQGALSQFIIPAGTPIGTICGGTIPCRSGSFLSLAAVSGDTADVIAVAILSGPIL